MNFLKKLEYTVQHFPNRLCLSYRGDSVSYDGFYCKCLKLANYIDNITNGVKNCPIMIFCERGIEFVVAIVSVMMTGNYFVPIEKPCPKDRVLYIYDQLKAPLVLSDCDLVDARIQTHNINNSFSQFTLYTYDSSVYNSEDICYAMFTSGTTGFPKGVRIKNKSLLNLIQGFLSSIYLLPSVNVGVLSSFSFDASLKQIFGALYYAHSLIIAEKEDKLFSQRLQMFLAKNDIAIVDGTPSIYRLLLGHPKKQNISTKYFLIGGEMLDWDLVNGIYDYLGYYPTIINLYGPTECCVDASSYWIMHPNYNSINQNVPIGQPIEGASFYIAYESSEEFLGMKCGELYISGILVGEGYINLDNDNSFVDWNGNYTYKTGDYVYLTADNEYMLVGRIDSQVKINGNRVDLLEIKKAISNVTGINEVYVCKYIHKSFDCICAFVKNGDKAVEQLDEKMIKSKLMETLPLYEIPKIIKYIDCAIPITTHGKIDLTKLCQTYIKE